MFRRVYLLSLALLVPLATACNNECLLSSDIQVNVLPDPSIDPSQITALHVALSVNGSPAKTRVIVLTQPIDRTGSAFILRPDSTPARATYTISVTIEAMDNGNTLIAIGSDSEQVAAKGCNHLNAHLAALPLNPTFDMAQSILTDADGFINRVSDMDAAGGMPSPDLAGCVGGLPDEDNDGRANFCDLCPADYDPTPSDSDGDGLPDACDPDPTRKTNMQSYFDAFDSDSGHWNGSTYTIAPGTSFMQIDSNNAAPNQPLSVASNVRVPLDVRAQTFVLAPGYYGSTGPALAIAALFLGDGTDPFAPGTNGVLCQIRFDQSNGDAIRLRPVVNGSLQLGTSTPTSSTACAGTTLPPPPQFCFGTDTLYRLRLTQRGSSYSCEVVDGNGNTYTPPTLTATPPAGPTQFLVLQEANLKAQFHSVVAETALSP
jgi:hypothetical protein